MATKVKRLTPAQRNFLADWGHLVQTYNVPAMANIFGVSKQAVQQQIDKKKEKHENI